MRLENLDGMSSEQLMLRDLIYEIPDLLVDADKENRDFQHGVFTALRLLEWKLQSFEIDQSRFTRQMPDIEAWYR
ncbi:hypothetical protein ACOYW6_05560 [Parablastomonas sp. CN1-191]|uniref:hypothetical protein n=1 Tax=Parablastomonas sp. CN1-191 TaxID=3400908 RepID=UPI003BF80875